MKFDRIIGECEKELILESEKRLTAIFSELALPYENRTMGSKMGGDIFLHQMISPLKQICDARSISLDKDLKSFVAKLEKTPIGERGKFADELVKLNLRSKQDLIRTASTDGKSVYWCPKFVCSKSILGLRLVVTHEGTHIGYMHPTRRGERDRGLWNRAVDFKVNNSIIVDLRARSFFEPENVFRKELGNFFTIKEYYDYLKDPFNPPEKLKLWSPIVKLENQLNGTVTESESLYCAEPNLHQNMQTPESIYDYLMSAVPRCVECGRAGIYKKPIEYKELESKLGISSKNESHACH